MWGLKALSLNKISLVLRLVVLTLISFFLFSSITKATEVNYTDEIRVIPISFPTTLESNKFTAFSFTADNETSINFTNNFLTFYSDKLILTNVTLKLSSGATFAGEFYSQPGTKSRVFFTADGGANSFANVPYPDGERATYTFTVKTDPAITNSFHVGDSVGFSVAFYGNTANGVEYTSQAPAVHNATISRLNSLLQPIDPPAGTSPTPTFADVITPVVTLTSTPTNSPNGSPQISPTPSTIPNDSMIITIPAPPGVGTTPPPSNGGPTPTPVLLGDLNNLTKDDLKNLGDLTLEVPGANKIEFTEPVDLSKLTDAKELKELVFLNETGKVFVNFGKLDGIDRSAKITMTNLHFDGEVTLLRNGVDATPFITNVHYDKATGILTFNTKKMGNYEAVAAKAKPISTALILKIVGGSAVVGLLGFGLYYSRRLMSKKNKSSTKVESEDSEYTSSVV
jgi:hypothetical protein